MDHVHRGCVIFDENHLKIPAKPRLAPDAPFAVPRLAGIRPARVTNNILGLLRLNAVFGNMLKVVFVPAEVRNHMGDSIGSHELSQLRRITDENKPPREFDPGQRLIRQCNRYGG